MPAHWVLFTYFAWGHLRPESNLAVTLARKFPDITISCIVDTDFLPKCRDEMKRNAMLGGDESLLARIRLIPIGRALVDFTPELAAIYPTLDPRIAPATSPADVQKLTDAFDAMMEERAFKDELGGNWEALSKPSLTIADMMLGNVLPVLKKKYGVPLYIWFVECAAPLTRKFGPTEKGGRAPGYVEECLAVEADPDKRMGREFWEIAQQVWARSDSFKDDIVRVKGLPPFYQWEDLPQKTWYPAFYDSMSAGYPLFQLADGVLLPAVVDVEREGVEGVMDWYGGKLLCVGPQFPAGFFGPVRSDSELAGTEVPYHMTGTDQSTPGQRGADPCIAFLDDALNKYGPNSAIYISFGSLFFPNPRHVQILLETILGLEKPMMFIMTTASPNAVLSEELLQKIKESHRGLVVPWAPQQAILAHSALGAIVSHCGAGGTLESLSQGVPVIGWPFFSDQPLHALWMSEVLDTGFEFLQVRDGPVKGKAYRGGPNGTDIVGTDDAIAKEMKDVLNAFLGEVGKRKRSNAEKVKQLVWKAHQPGGQIDQHLDILRQYAGVVSSH